MRLGRATIVFALAFCFCVGSFDLLAQGVPSAATPDTDPLVLTTNLGVDFEYTYRSANELVEPYAVQSGIDITRDYIDRPAFFNVDWNFGRKEGLSVAFGSEIKQQFTPSVDGGYFSPTNIPVIGGQGTPVAFDTHFVNLGVLRWNSPNLKMEIGRDKTDYGSEIDGSLLPSPRLPYLDAFRLRGDIGPLRVDWMIATLQEVRSWQGNDVDPNQGTGGADYYGFNNDINPSTVIEAMHRFTWNFGAFSLGVTGNIVYARRNNYYLLTDFLPVISWHQTQSLSNNLTLILEGSWRPIPELTAAAELGFDDINANIFGVSDTPNPTIPAFVLGVHYDAPTTAGPFSSYFEAGYTHYLWGNYSGAGDAPNDVDPLAREQYRLMMDAGAALIPLTSPYGPGAIWLTAKASIGITGTGLKVGANVLLLSKNTIANLISTPYDFSAENGPREFFISAGFPISYRLGPFEIYTAPTLCARDSTLWFEEAIGCRYSFHRDTKIAD